jgi:hypothetical protein
MGRRTASIIKFPPVPDDLVVSRIVAPAGDATAPEPYAITPQPSAVATPTGSDISEAAPPMAPGIQGFNIDRPPSSTMLVQDGEFVQDGELLKAPPAAPEIHELAAMARLDRPARRLGSPADSTAIDGMRQRKWLTEDLPQPPIPIGEPPLVRWAGRCSLASSLITIVAVVGFKLMAPAEDTLDQANDITGTVTSDTAPRPGRSTPRLIVDDQSGVANEPLPIGISLADASGEETVTVVGLAAGTELSLGTALGGNIWLVPVRDLDKTFVGAPADFVGVMDAAVNLHSAGDRLLDSRNIRFEWNSTKKEGRQTSALDASEPAPVVAEPLGSEEIATLIKIGEDLLRHGEIAAARLLLKRAAGAGHAQAALKLAMTFDPAFLTKWGVLGIAADEAQAREWYDRAMALGGANDAGTAARLRPGGQN